MMGLNHFTDCRDPSKGKVTKHNSLFQLIHIYMKYYILLIFLISSYNQNLKNEKQNITNPSKCTCSRVVMIFFGNKVIQIYMNVIISLNVLRKRIFFN